MILFIVFVLLLLRMAAQAGRRMMASTIRIELKEPAKDQFIVMLTDGDRELMTSKIFNCQNEAQALIDQLIEGCEWEVFI